MRRVAACVLAREQRRLLDGGVDHEQNIVSALVETVTRLVVQELLEGEQGDFLGGRGRYERRGEGSWVGATATSGAGCGPAEGFVDVAVPQVRGAGEPFRSGLMSFLDGNGEVLESLVDEMYARGQPCWSAGASTPTVLGLRQARRGRGNREHPRPQRAWSSDLLRRR